MPRWSCSTCVAERDGRFCGRCGAAAPVLPGEDEWLGVAVADRYEVVELLRVGGMGSVYRARQRMLDRDVAIKFIHRHLARDESAVSRFLGEARAASRLNHPNVVCIHDFGRHGTDLFLARELVSGAPLSDLVARNEAFGPQRVGLLLHQVLAGL